MKYQVTGNEYVSLPTIRESDASIFGISFLHMGCKGMLELRGTEERPLLRPFVEIDGKRQHMEQLEWTLDEYWVPSFTTRSKDMLITGIWLAPLGERGFGCKLAVENNGSLPAAVRFGLEGCWADTMHSVNESKPVDGVKHAYDSNWNHCFALDIRVGTPLFAFAPIISDEAKYSYSAEPDGTVSFVLYKDAELEQAQSRSDVFWFGLGFEEVSAATSAKEMMRQGFEAELKKTRKWLTARKRTVGSDRLDFILNRNMFFSFFFASGLTLDTEELALITSRSPRYYVSAAYWDRDSLLWSFPAILMADVDFAREALCYVFTRQIRNVGIHSRYIDGSVLEPGFELDELCAPALALSKYVEATGDRDLLTEPFILHGIERILKILKSKKHPEIDLYETFLQPTDDMHVHRYITYDNVLVWRMLTDLAEMYGRSELSELADCVKSAIMENCIKTEKGKRLFAWSVDLCGKWDIYDEPPGSLMLLPHYGFCLSDDEVWRSTTEAIRDPGYPYSFADCKIAEIGCPHAPHPWVLSIANSLLSGHADTAREHLLLCGMDNGIACESVDENTGESRTGDAFATCAGFLAYAIDAAFSSGESK